MARVGVAVRAHHERMQMAVGPADRHLKDGVQPVERGVAGHLQPPPDGRRAAEQDDLQLVDRGVAFAGGGFSGGDHALKGDWYDLEYWAAKRRKSPSGRAAGRSVSAMWGVVTAGSVADVEHLTLALLYVCFHLPCLAESQTGRWGRLPSGRGAGGGADALVAL